MHSMTKNDSTLQLGAENQAATTTKSTQPAKSADAPMSLVIASLTNQLRRENETISQLVLRQRKLRQELLKAQEQSLAALRHRSASESIDA